MATATDRDVDRRIVAAAQHEIAERGVIGLRVATVAERADTSVAMIYRRFVDRDGLLDAALADYYEQRIDQVLAVTRAVLETPGDLTLDHVLAAVPLPEHDGAEERHRFIHRIMVVASENESLRARVSEIITAGFTEFEQLMERIVDRLPADQQFDPRIFTMYVVQHGWLINDLRGAGRITNERYLDFLRHLCTHVPRPDH